MERIGQILWHSKEIFEATLNMEEEFVAKGNEGCHIENGTNLT